MQSYRSQFASFCTALELESCSCLAIVTELVNGVLLIILSLLIVVPVADGIYIGQIVRQNMPKLTQKQKSPSFVGIQCSLSSRENFTYTL